METKFQTSFIPKKSLPAVGMSSVRQSAPGGGASIFMVIAVFAFLASLAAVAGAYLWKQYLLSAQQSQKTELAAREQQFDIGVITDLKGENIKIDMAKQLLANHVAFSQIFSIISLFTIENVRFLSMDLSTPTAGGSGAQLTMTGYGTNLASVAFQSDVFNKLKEYGLSDIVKNPIMTNPSLDTNGTVSFGFTATVNPSSLSYSKAASSGASPDAASQGATTTNQ